MNPRILARKFALSLFSGVALLMIAEIAARLAEPGPFALHDQSPYERHASLHHVHKRGFRGSWDGTYYEINGQRARGPALRPTFEANELRVVALGDSCTFGKGVEESATWPRRLEAKLSERLGASRAVLAANLGVNGYSGRDYVTTYFAHADALRPHVVVIGYNINDFPNEVKKVDAEVFQNETNLRSMVSWRWREQLGKLACWRWMRGRYYDWNRDRDFRRVEQRAREAGDEAVVSPERMQLEKERLRELVDACKAEGTHVVLFLFPYESQVYLDEFARGPIDVVRSMAAELDVPFVEMLEVFRTQARAADPPVRLFLRGDRYHPNPAGYDLVAGALAEFIEQQGWTRVGG